MSARLRLLGVFAAAQLVGCMQSDLVARAEPVCNDGRCACSASGCEDLDASRTAFCSHAGFSSVTGDACAGGGVNAPVYAQALCSCMDITLGGGLRVDAYEGLPDHGVAEGGDVGANRNFDSAYSLDVGGTLRVGGAVSTGQSLLGEGIEGGIQQVTSPPCHCSDLLDVASLVSARQSDNDNQAQGLLPSALDSIQGDATLTLSCGRYFLTRMAVSGNLSLSIQGRVALFVASNLELDGAFRVNVQAGGSLELFVAGNVRAGGAVALGDPQRGQESFRMLVGGAGTIDLRGESVIAGVVYAPEAELVAAQNLSVYGALVVRRAAPGKDLTVHYDTALAAPQSCSP